MAHIAYRCGSCFKEFESEDQEGSVVLCDRCLKISEYQPEKKKNDKKRWKWWNPEEPLYYFVIRNFHAPISPVSWDWTGLYPPIEFLTYTHSSLTSIR